MLTKSGNKKDRYDTKKAIVVRDNRARMVLVKILEGPCVDEQKDFDRANLEPFPEGCVQAGASASVAPAGSFGNQEEDGARKKRALALFGKPIG